MTASPSWPKHVGIVVNAWPQPDGEPSGTGRNAQYVATELARRGIDVSVLVTTSTGRQWRGKRTESLAGVHVESLDLYRPTYRSSYRSALGDAELRAWLATRRPYVVHVIHPGECGVGAPAVIASLGIPVALTACDALYGCHMGHLINPRERRPLCELPIAEAECARCMSVGTGVDPEWMRPLARERRELATASVAAGPIVADSEFTRRQLRAAFPLSEVSLLPLPTPPAPGHAPARSGPLVLGFFGAPTWRKGLDLLLDAVDGVAGVQLEVHGPTIATFEATYAAALVARSQAMPNVTWVGAYPPREAITRMRAVDIVVVPSRAESLPGVVKEALAAGRPVIGARVAGIPELVTPSNGWLVEPDSGVDLNVLIRHLIANLGEVRALKPALELSVETYVDQLLSTYQAARDQADPWRAARALEESIRNSGAEPFLRRDERYQTALVTLSTGHRWAAFDIARSFHRSASDRLWETLAWLLWWPTPFGRAFRRVLRVQDGRVGRESKVRTVSQWLKAVGPYPRG